MNWQPISECPIPAKGSIPPRVLFGGVGEFGLFTWEVGAMDWDGNPKTLFPRIAIVTHFCVVTPPEAKP